MDLNLSDLILTSGYKSIYAFAKEMGEDPNNMNKIVNGAYKYTLNIKKALKFGKALNLSLEEIMWVFYPEYMSEFTK